ncbi:hypothetical protein GFS24_20460 [Chitinophaga sp. SYP-B3965]|uniref:hypothetical protein n=1 Tax=Chitinophaga sp. SYP-B3965 TaxID=2663120 RepID=UPI00129A06A7|nr:hypothetical protein [Chitinophaga sp. SYP-B3965]MRG47506.1 hypothetical protein [Chitinophaga sp. SYP-B3965]
MKRFLLFLATILPLVSSAQKLSETAVEDVSTKMATQFLKLNDPALVFVTEQMNRSGSGGLEIDKTMQELKKDPAAMDAALKFLFQYSDCNRQTLISNLKAMNIQSGNVFPVATYVVNKYKGETKALQEEKTELYKIGAIPKVISVMVAPPTSQAQAVTTTTLPPGSTVPTPTNTVTDQPQAALSGNPAAGPADTRNWDVRVIFQINTPTQLQQIYGKENMELRDVNDLDGNSAGKAWVIYPDTDDEMEVIFHEDSSKSIMFGKERSKWKPPFGIKPGDPIEKVTKVNTRAFKVNGFEWTNGGIVDSWQGGAMDKKGVEILFRAVNTGDPKLYDQFTGEKKFSSDNSGLKRLGVIVEKVVFTTYQ